MHSHAWRFVTRHFDQQKANTRSAQLSARCDTSWSGGCEQRCKIWHCYHCLHLNHSQTLRDTFTWVDGGICLQGPFVKKQKKTLRVSKTSSSKHSVWINFCIFIMTQHSPSVCSVSLWTNIIMIWSSERILIILKNSYKTRYPSQVERAAFSQWKPFCTLLLLRNQNTR